jgi:hypothetical protein
MISFLLQSPGSYVSRPRRPCGTGERGTRPFDLTSRPTKAWLLMDADDHAEDKCATSSPGPASPEGAWAAEERGWWLGGGAEGAEAVLQQVKRLVEAG